MRSKFLTALLVILPYAGWAQTPLSAIDWLNGNPPVHLGDPNPVWPLTPITSQPLDKPNMDAAGLLPQTVTGFPMDLWEGSQTADLVAQIGTLPAPKLPALQALLHTLLLAEARAPSGGSDGAFLFARIDLLTRLGAVDPAMGLANLPNSAPPELQARRLALALLQDPLGASCPADFGAWADYATKIFCTARSGDWERAEIIFETAQSLGLLADHRMDLLAAFLDQPSQNNRPEPPTAQDAAMALTIGEPYATHLLPLPFSYADLNGTSGWKPAILAAERLVRAGAIDPNLLWGLYTDQTPAASGGVWDRTAAFANFRAALDASDTNKIADQLQAIWPLLQAEGLDIAFAETFAPRLVAFNWPASAQPQLANLLLAASRQLPAHWVIGSPDITFAQEVISGRAAWTRPQNQLQTQIRRGFISGLPDKQVNYVNQGQFGAALLQAIVDIETGFANQSDQLADGLAALRLLGLDHVARAASVQILLRSRL